MHVDIKVCRVCLSPKTKKYLFDDKNLKEKFEFTTKLKIKLNDGLPSMICLQCYTKLKIAYDFCSQAQTSDEQLRSFVDKMNSHLYQVTKTVRSSIKEATEEEMELLIEAGYKSTENDNTIIVDNEQIRLINAEQQTNENDLQMSNEVVEQEIQQKQEETQDYEEETEAGEVFFDYVETEEYSTEIINSETVKNSSNISNSSSAANSNPLLINAREEENYDNKTVANLVFTPSRVSTTTTDSQITTEYIDESNPFTCKKCKKKFSTKSNLLKHIHSHDGLKRYKCNICGNRFTQGGSLKVHMYIHTGERPHKCEVCDKSFTQSKTLVHHMRRHTGEKPCVCDLCGAAFRQTDGLKQHMLRRHSTEQKKFSCPKCGKILRSKYSLTSHLNNHDRGKPYKCSVCENEFPTKMSLTIHQRRHTGEMPYSCEMCKEGFAKKKLLLSHKCQGENSHEDEMRILLLKPEEDNTTEEEDNAANSMAGECGICKQNFTSKRLLERHILEHEIVDTN